MKKILFALSALISTFAAQAQSAYVLPSPTAANEPITLYIDVSQTSGGLKSILTAHPEVADQVYIWTWMPAGPLVGNGEWGASNEALLLTNVSGLLYSITFTPTEFYGVDGPTFFTRGISCLAKLKNGNDFPDDGFGEAKTEDLHVDIVPKLCDDIFCTFPEIAKQDDFFSITYDNNQETDANLMNLGDDEVYIYLLAKTGPFNNYPFAAIPDVANTPQLKMKPVAGKPGQFRITFVTNDFFTSVPAGSTISQVRYFILKPGYTPSIPVYQAYVFQDCE